MNPIEKTYLTNKLVGALLDAAGLVTPEQRYAIYQDSMRLLAVLLKNSKPLSSYRDLFPGVLFVEAINGLDVFPPDNASMSRIEAIDWRNRLLAEGLGQLTLFRVRYAGGGYVEYSGESEESMVLDRLVTEYGSSWKVFRHTNGVINLLSLTAMPTVDAETLAESMATTIKTRYPFEVISVRIDTNDSDGRQVKVVKR